MITTFWIIATLLILVALAFVIPPFLKPTTTSSKIDRQALNVAIYKERLAELEQEELTPAQREAAKQELDKTLLQELNGDTDLSPSPPRARWASVIVAILIPVIAVSTYWQLGSPTLIAPPLATNQAQQTDSPNGQLPANFKEMVDKLAARLEKQPEDEKGWQMLARSYVFLGDYSLAVKTYTKVLAKYGQKPEVLTELAEFIAKSNNDDLVGLPTILLKSALEANRNYPDALWLAGFAAAQVEDFQGAIDYWQRFRAQLPATDEEARQMVDKHLAEATQQLATRNSLPASGTPSVATTTTKVESAQPSQSQVTETKSETLTASGQESAMKAAKIEVKVNLDPNLKDQINPEDTLFIYARATQGPPMPVAIIKTTANTLPTTVTLDDSVGIAPNMKLSQFAEVIVVARVSKTGQAMPQPGDLQGQSTAPVAVGQSTPVEITINQVVP